MFIFPFPPTPSHRGEKEKISVQKQEHGFKITVLYFIFYPTPDVSELEIYVVFVVIIESQVDDRTIQQTPNPAAQLPDPLPPQDIH